MDTDSGPHSSPPLVAPSTSCPFSLHSYGISALLVDTDSPQPGFLTKRDFLKMSFHKNLKRTKVCARLVEGLLGSCWAVVGLLSQARAQAHKGASGLGLMHMPNKARCCIARRLR